MERFLKQYDKDYMKMAMLKHEETFREQVHELHRLYRVQKLLMRDMKKGSKLKRQQKSAYSLSDSEIWNAENCRPQRRMLDLERPAEEYVEESDIELTLAIGSGRKKKGASFTSESRASSSSSSTSESGGENVKLHDWGLFQIPDMNTGYPGDKSDTDVKEPMRQDGLKQPSWQLQYLSLNIT